MVEEPPVLDREHGVDDVWWQLGDSYRAGRLTALGENAAVKGACSRCRKADGSGKRIV